MGEKLAEKGMEKSNNKPIENLEIIKEIWNIIKELENIQCEILFVKVKGHSNNVLNNEADRLAVEAKKTAEKTGKTVGFNGASYSLLGKNNIVYILF